MRRPLSWSMRFALALSAVFVIGTLIAGGLSYLFLSREMTARLSADVRSGAESLARIAATGDRTDLEEQILAQVRSSRDGASLFAFVDAATGRTIGYTDVAPDALRPGLLAAGLPAAYADFLLLILGYFKAGYSERTTDAVQQITGQAPRTIEQYAADYRASWV